MRQWLAMALESAHASKQALKLPSPVPSWLKDAAAAAQERDKASECAALALECTSQECHADAESPDNDAGDLDTNSNFDHASVRDILLLDEAGHPPEPPSLGCYHQERHLKSLNTQLETN